MGQKVNPIGLRLGINRTWDSIWFASEKYRAFLHEDIKIKEMLKKRYKKAGIVRINVHRYPEKINVVIETVRPGMVIGPKGATIEEVKAQLKGMVSAPINLSIVEIKKPETVAKTIADSIAQQLEQRMPFRRAMKQALRGAMRGGVEGVKIAVSGRLNGADMSRREQYKEGRIPLHTLRGRIDFALSEAKTTYGIIGVKVWVYNGDAIVTEEETQQGQRDNRRKSR
ncbi:30S ribosomal protein S3 [Leptonema illini]|jgi:small subunit ribosomal protein S3|uniref:Small ribosomal subunit protein uS3 n=1 Tax=Leptonema illini DSM 21528 TaxID=929563 RepID=H2CAN2_9LEPT|nr:30S ribosomal protein S3 [Leptonema illini]EHQ08410.1 SSU ribosomal protein S3P [Leptonema illini DSM 21528]